MESEIKILNAEKKERSIQIEWSDGNTSDYNFLWLRDNCPSEIHPTARERTFNLLTVSESIHPKSFTISEDNSLSIKWSEGDHSSNYSYEWLRKNCYTLKNLAPYKTPYQLWDQSIQNNIEKIQIDCDEIMSGDEGATKYLEQLHYYGISLVQNAPTSKKSAEDVLKKISHFRETFFETPFEVINIPNPNNSAYTALGLRNHLDLPYFEIPPGYQFLHCLLNEADGGESVALDGFKVASFMQKEFPEYFKILTETHVKFCNRDYTQNTTRIHYSPLITLTKDNDFNIIRFSIAYMSIMDCTPDKMDLFYKAYRKFAELLHDKRFTINFKLKAGDIFSFNNLRVLHGRTEFDPNSGERHLQGYYIDRDEIIGRLNFLKKVES
jgi:gamma-butyrobetaine dioxygenase|tara:strand:+ start:44 stop:1186 length:1143 start_codon:yes stop_codon:yes gene_type:complete